MKKNKLLLRWKIAIGLVVFAVVIYLSIFVIQSILNSVVFRKTQEKNADQLLERISDTISNSDLKNPNFHIEELFRDYNIIERIDTVIIYLDDDQQLVVLNKEVMPNINQDYERYWNANYSVNQSFTELNNDFLVKGVFIKDLTGRDCLIYYRTIISQMGITLTIANRQLLYSSIIIIVFVLIFAVLFDYQIAKPISSLTESAELLAKGKYDTKFEVKGFMEIEKLGDTLNYAAQELSKTDSYRKELIANVSHDLRTPLTLIGGYAEMMRDMPSEVKEENFQIIIDEANRLNLLVNDILTLNDIQNNTVDIEKHVYSITDDIIEIINHHNMMVKEMGIKIEFIYDEKVNIDANKEQINKVIYNFLSNAIKFIGEDKLIIVKQTIINDKVRLSVIDHGVGLAEDEITTVWNRYYRANNNTRATAGSGLGLSIAKEILISHHFEYGVNSKKSEGSEFWFEAPIFK